MNDDGYNWSIDDGCAELEGEDLLERWVENLAKRYCHFPSGKVDQQIVDMVTGHEFRKQAFVDKFVGSKTKVNAETPQGAATTKVVKATDRLLEHRDLVEIDGYAFRPGETKKLLKIEGETKLNIWQPVHFDVEPTEDEIKEGGRHLEALLAHMFRDEKENDWAFNWFARLTGFPGERGAAMVIITQTTGTGRGVLIKLLERMVGRKWTGAVKIEDLTGSSAAAAYSSNLVNKVLITCAEASTSNKNRDAAMENMKVLVSPYPEQVMFNPKGKAAYSDMVYYSTLIASNDAMKALPISEEDRRFCIVQGPSVKMDDPNDARARAAKAAADAFFPLDTGDAEAVARAERLLAGAYTYLIECESDAKQFATILETNARTTLIEGDRGEIEIALAEALEHLPEGSSGVMFNELLSKVNQRLGRKPTDGYARGVLTKRLSAEFQNGSGQLVRGFDGWVLLPGQQRVEPSGEVPFRKITGLSQFKSGDREGEQWQVRGLVVPASEVDGMTPQRRGQIVEEVLTRFTAGTVLSAIEGGKKGAR